MKKIGFILFLCFGILTARFLDFYSQSPTYSLGQPVSFSHTFLQDPQINRFGIQTLYANELLITFSEDNIFQYGDTVVISGVVGEKSFFSTKENRVIKQKTLENIMIEKKSDSNFILALAFIVRQKVSETFYHVLPRNEAGLLMGIVFGIRSSMEKELADAFRSTGVLHVVAASGTNVTMVGEILLLSLIPFVKRRIAVLFTVAGIFFYALIAGFAPSILRAAIMASFAYGAVLFGRQNYSLLALLFAAFLMVVFQPDVIFDVGFQLSFMATIGILFIKPFFDRVQFGKKIFLFDDFSTTTAAQITTLPIMIFVFSSYSFIGLIVNPLVLWTIPILMILGGLAAVFSLVFPILSIPFLYISYPLLVYFEQVTLFFAQYSFPFQVEDVPLALIAGYYCVTIGIMLALYKRKNKT
jgi:competence protein ComEC